MMNNRLNGIDTNAIVIDSDGRFELSESQLSNISGGMKKRGVIVIYGSKCKKVTEPTCPPGTIEVIRGGHGCTCG